jgi:hypothetical protein
MSVFADAFRGLKRLVTGEVIRRIDTPANMGWTTMSLRLKRERRSGDLYVILAGLSRGNYQYFTFTKDEFASFASGVESINDTLQNAPDPSLRSPPVTRGDR